jgi:hypothetical protein
MSQRPGPFWDAVQGRAPLPRAAATLGLRLLDADEQAGTIELSFKATEDFTNPTGNVLGHSRRRCCMTPSAQHCWQPLGPTSSSRRCSSV